MPVLDTRNLRILNLDYGEFGQPHVVTMDGVEMAMTLVLSLDDFCFFRIRV